MYGRHNQVRDTLAEILRGCGFPCTTEVTLPGSERRPADIFAPSFPPADVAFDTSVVHPLPPSQPSAALATVTSGSAAQKQEEVKVKKCQEDCAKRAWSYLAFVGETTGAWGQAAQRTVKKLVRARCLRSGEEPSEVAHEVWGTLAASLAGAVGRQLSRARTLGTAVRGGPQRLSVPEQTAPPPLPPASSTTNSSSSTSAGPAAGDLELARDLCGRSSLP